MQGPLSAAVLMLELVDQADRLVVPMLVAIVGATVVSRLLHAPSIYSARLSEDEPPADEPEPFFEVPGSARLGHTGPEPR
ncbi:hypothetical protein NBH00_03735 [Paraconexibacter antarcticus]|uniref:Uncharacterized protein n=1 Tax=Paraconexibacter antarcticus TaxID=2949664 RepID=A0ABY5DWS9_9ACTN|nr:hypothetical protein [Paraconexibacter antarcticus]UTI65327.1 hypothetical protein NBH00_03735 [Paraconexibacter antarcticus]